MVLPAAALESLAIDLAQEDRRLVLFLDDLHVIGARRGRDGESGYQSEAATWRNAYLTGATELRTGKPKVMPTTSANPDVIRAIPLGLLFGYLAVRLDPAKAEGKRMVINWELPDTKQQARMNLDNSVLTHAMGKQAADADATITLNRSTLVAVTLRQKTFAQAAGDGSLKISGNAAKLSELMDMLDEFTPLFDIVTPNKPEKDDHHDQHRRQPRAQRRDPAR